MCGSGFVLVLGEVTGWSPEDGAKPAPQFPPPAWAGLHGSSSTVAVRTRTFLNQGLFRQLAPRPLTGPRFLLASRVRVWSDRDMSMSPNFISDAGPC